VAESYTVHIYVAPPHVKSDGTVSAGHAYVGIIPNGSSGDQPKYYGLHPDNYRQFRQLDKDN